MRTRSSTVVLALSVLAACGGGEAAAPPSSVTTSVVEATTTTAPQPPPAPTTTAPAGPVRYVSPYTRLDTPQALAAEIADAESIARDPARSMEERARAGRRAQVRYRQLLDQPAWDAPVAAALPPALRDDAKKVVEGGRQLLALLSKLPDTMPPWEIVDPKPPADLVRFYKEAAAAIGGADWTVLAAVHFVETKLGRIRGLSTAGARGPMQFIPSSWKAFGAGGNIDDDRDSIFAAARHLKASGREPFDLNKALFGYNHSMKYVEGVKAYAQVIAADEQAYVSLHAWETFYRTVAGDFILVKGYREEARFPVADYAARPAVTLAP